MSRIVRHPRFASQYVSPRHLDVWLPPGYDTELERRYPVIYMHDGQNLFDAADSNFGVSWAVDQAMLRVIDAGQAPPAIIVGVWNTPLRNPEYLPARLFAGLPARTRERLLAYTGGLLLSDEYLAFLVTEVKPFIDGAYRTQPEPSTTGVMGSSRGGLISLYAIAEYPDVLGGAGCVSTHWPAVEGLILPYLRKHLPDPASHRIYFDYGTHTLDALYTPLQAIVDPVMRERGYVEGSNWVTRAFPGAAHFERDWAERVHIPLRFLLAGA